MGVTYYKLEQRYEGDRTKGCGLTTAEMDENFHFLRGYDIKDAYFEDGILTLERVNCDKIIVEGIPEYIRSIADEKMDGFEPEIDLTGSTYNEVTGVLTIMVNGEPYEISGFLTPDYDFKLYVGNGLDGRGTIANPLRVSHVNDTGFLAPVERIIPEGEPLPSTNEKGSMRYLTKEKKSPYGLLYSAEDALKIDAWLQENNTGWRLPTIDDWNEMLNALECSDDDRNHDKENPFDGEELGAAAARFLKAEEFNDEPEINRFNALPIFWDQDNLTREDILAAGFWSSDRSDDGGLKAKDLHQFEDKVVHENGRYNHTTLKSIRLIKDVELNTYEDEEIGGVTYKTVPMPAWSKDAKAVYATKLWLAENLRIDVVDGVRPVEPEGRGYYFEDEEAYNKAAFDVYYVNMWDPFGNKWTKRELKENDVVIVNNYDESGNSEEVIVQVDENGNQVLIPHFQELRDAIEDVNNRLDEEIVNRTAADEALDNKIGELSAGTENRIDELSANTFQTINELSAGTEERIDRLTQDTFNAISALSEETKDTIEELSAGTEEKITQLAEATAEKLAELSGATDGKIDEVTGNLNELSASTEEKFTELSGSTVQKFSDLDRNIEDINEELGTIKTKTVDSNDPLISLDSDGVISSSFKVVYDPGNKAINFYGINRDEPLFSISTEDFVRDGMIDSVRVETPTSGIHAGQECLIITFNAAAKDGSDAEHSKQDVEIPLTEFAKIYKGSDYVTIDGNYVISVKTGPDGLATWEQAHASADTLNDRITEVSRDLERLENKVGVGYTGASITYKIEELREEIAYEIADMQENAGKVGDNIYYKGGKIIDDGDTIGEALQEIVNIIADNGSGIVSKNIKDKDGAIIIEEGATVTEAAEKLLQFTENHNESLISRDIPAENPIVLSGDTTTAAVEKVINYINNTVATAVEEMQDKVDDIDERLTAIEEEGSSVKNLEGADEDVELFEESGITKILVKGISNPEPITLDMKRTIYIKFGSEDNNPNNIEVHDYWDETYTFTVPPTPSEGQRWFIDTNDSYGVDDGEVVLRVGEEYTINLYGRGATVLIPVRLFNTGV